MINTYVLSSLFARWVVASLTPLQPFVSRFLRIRGLLLVATADLPAFFYAEFAMRSMSSALLHALVRTVSGTPGDEESSL